MKNRRYHLQARRAKLQETAVKRGALPFGVWVTFHCAHDRHVERQGEKGIILEYTGAGRYAVMYGGGKISVERTCFTV